MKNLALHLALHRSAAVLAATLVLLSGLALGQAKDSLLGNWVLDRGKSVFDPDTTLLSRSLSFEAKDGGVSFLQKTVQANGNTVQIDYVAKYDSKDVPISGSQLDTVGLRRVNANTVERSGKIKGQVAETVTMVVSNGGKTLTITTKGSIEGTDYSSTQVYTKE
jgi:hypothetical protein